MLTHRPFAEADFERVCSFPQTAQELFHAFPRASYPLSPAQLRQAVDQRRDSTVVECNGLVVAFANFYRWENGTYCIGNLMVSPEARGRGVAFYLVEVMTGLALSRHAAVEIRVACFNGNTPGLLLCHKFGFEPFQLEARCSPEGEPVMHASHAALYRHRRLAREGTRQR